MNQHLVLYRKYRPQRFSEVIGQEHIIRTLTNSILNKNISHAYLFAGPRGSGKTTIARLFAKAINCENLEGFEPCNKCSSCLEISNSKSLDLIEIDAASHRGIDEIRELREGIKFLPAKARYKVFIIDECHQLSKDAANALLKTLEEPPPYVVFILATTEAHRMIPTIVSRCQRFDFRKLQTAEIIKKLKFIAEKEGVKFEEGALSLIALNSRGSFRDAESLLDQCISFITDNKKEILMRVDDVKELLGIVEAGQIAQFVDYLISKDSKEAVLFLDNIAKNGADLQEFVKTLIFYLRQALLFKINPDYFNQEHSSFSEEEMERLKKQAQKVSLEELRKMIEIFVDAENRIKYSSISQLPLELAILNIIHFREV